MIPYKSKCQCCGCMACIDICPKNAIDVITDRYGFDYPQIDNSKCVDCGLCKKVCPFVEKPKIENFDKNVYAAKSIDDSVRMTSSSGGIYSLLSDEVLIHGGTVYGAAYTSKDTVSHIRCANTEERDKTKSSKYVQSNMLGVYKQIRGDLDDGRIVLFSGTPCQTAAVRKFCGVNAENLLTVDVVCHGVPSPKLFKEHIEFCERQTNKTLKQFNFRLKTGDGRNQNRYAVYDDGSIDKKKKYLDVYFNLFNENKILRECCFSCPYACEERVSDITLGDYWGIKDIMPDFTDGYGVSAVIVNSEKGKKLLKSVENYAIFNESNYTDVSKRNPNLKRPSTPPKRNSVWFKYKIMGYRRLAEGYCKDGLVKKLKIKIAKFIK